ncbi:hypothetical protein CBR_g41411 [Chara braunii]|uniref:Uncharacterized protein n=1 Tax=Chara braunii TaxID=69332 RepID=A0A388LVY0_CHABU|nr:hypothetical protein CBR_g41411 [Chara braunii]|eukprot:GBG86415.1 hypothetical protein CBR_g41411 [Chara braunii]
MLFSAILQPYPSYTPAIASYFVDMVRTCHCIGERWASSRRSSRADKPFRRYYDRTEGDIDTRNIDAKRGSRAAMRR